MSNFIHYAIVLVVIVVALIVILMIKDQLRLFFYTLKLNKIGDFHTYRRNHPSCVKPSGDVLCYKCKSDKTIRVTNLRKCSKCGNILYHIANDEEK